MRRMRTTPRSQSTKPACLDYLVGLNLTLQFRSSCLDAIQGTTNDHTYELPPIGRMERKPEERYAGSVLGTDESVVTHSQAHRWRSCCIEEHLFPYLNQIHQLRGADDLHEVTIEIQDDNPISNVSSEEGPSLLDHSKRRLGLVMCGGYRYPVRAGCTGCTLSFHRSPILVLTDRIDRICDSAEACANNN